MITFELDNKSLNSYDDNLTIFQFCFRQNLFLPCFCYHERLSIAGNCRMCLVQINDALGVSCAINLIEGMIIYTNNRRVKESRESILEFLLVNHPLDCPICDQGGECDLQDITLTYGSDRGRFYENAKKAVDNLYMGPLIKTIMTRCIHCTRCVRFAFDVSNFMLGVIGRGINMEIGSFVKMNYNDELSGNIIDLCPVGALTSMPTAYKYRVWELEPFNNVDFLDSLSASIKIYVYGNTIKRILPSLNEELNEEWITNKTRFSFDSLIINRLNYPKIKINNKLVVFSWKNFIPFFLKILNYNFFRYISGFIGPFVDLTGALNLKTFFSIFGCSNLSYYNVFNWIYDFKFSFLYNNSLLELEKVSLIFFVGSNLRLENPLLNSRIRKNYLLNENNSLLLISFGLSLKYLTYPIINCGNNILNLICFMEGKIRKLSNIFYNLIYSSSLSSVFLFSINNPKFLLGLSLLKRWDSRSFFFSFVNILKCKFSIESFNLISTSLGFLSACEFSFKTFLKNKNFKLSNYFVGIDSFNQFNLKNSFTTFQGFIKSSSNIFLNAKICIPVKAPYECDLYFLNLEGRYRLLKECLIIMNNIYSDWEIFSILILFNSKYKILQVSIIDNVFLDFFQSLINYSCNFFYELMDFYKILFFFTGEFLLNIKFKNKPKNFIYNNLKKILKFVNSKIFRYLNNHYNDDFFLKNSKIMSLCSYKSYILNW